jgi:hypothetical protein
MGAGLGSRLIALSLATFWLVMCGDFVIFVAVAVGSIEVPE